MPFALRRLSGGDLTLTAEHDAIAAPRKGDVDWTAFQASVYTAEQLDAAAVAWRERALQEFHSLALFTQLASQIHLLGAPLDWSGAFARMIADEVRHTDLCLKLCERLERPLAPVIQEGELHILSAAPLREQARDLVIAAFCVGETISGRMFRRALKAATVPLARQVVAAIVVDEAFHEELGWELGALLMRGITGDERAALASRLPGLFAHYMRLCGAERGPSWASAEPERDPAPNFGTLTAAGYARAFFDGMAADVVPGLVAIGLPEAEPAFEALVASAREEER